MDIGTAYEDLAYTGVKSTGTECQAACQGNISCDFFVWGGPAHHYIPNGCWLKQFKGQNVSDITRYQLNGAFAGIADCLERGYFINFI